MKTLLFFLSIIGAMGADLATENAQLKAELEKYKTPWRISAASANFIRLSQIRRVGALTNDMVYIPVGTPSKGLEDDLVQALHGLFTFQYTKGTKFAAAHLEEGLTVFYNSNAVSLGASTLSNNLIRVKVLTHWVHDDIVPTNALVIAVGRKPFNPVP